MFLDVLFHVYFLFKLQQLFTQQLLAVLFLHRWLRKELRGDSMKALSVFLNQSRMPDLLPNQSANPADTTGFGRVILDGQRWRCLLPKGLIIH
jgi:hypothetical protein